MAAVAPLVAVARGAGFGAMLAAEASADGDGFAEGSGASPTAPIDGAGLTTGGASRTESAAGAAVGGSEVIFSAAVE